MTRNNVDLFLRHPLILPVENEEATTAEEYRGHLPVQGTDYMVHIRRTSPEAEFTLLHLSPPLENVRIQGTDIVKVLDDLAHRISTSKSTRTSLVDRKQMNLYRLVLAEYSELKEFYINLRSCEISPDLSTVSVRYADESNRVHSLVVTVDPNEPVNVFKVNRHSLPEKKDQFDNRDALKPIYEKFLGYVDVLQPYFDAMDGLDRACWVVDPEKPTGKDRFRRIALDTNLSMVVTVDPWKITVSAPDVKFLGPDRLTEAVRERVARNLIRWNTEGEIVQELLKVLEISEFPSRAGKTNEPERNHAVLYHSDECCICFSARLDDKLPEIVCPNRSCEKNFHRECIQQWLTSVGAKQSFNELHGQCPNCEKNISCPL